jgi:hypothetical protein
MSLQTHRHPSEQHSLGRFRTGLDRLMSVSALHMVC